MRRDELPARPTAGGRRPRGGAIAGNTRGGNVNQGRNNQQQKRTLGQRRPQNGANFGGNRPAQQQQQHTPRVRNLPPTESQLKALQVKAELNKLGDAPRAYLEKLQLSESMSIDNSVHGGSKLSLNERFEKIQGARISNPMRGGR